jgi:hypothetical protein
MTTVNVKFFNDIHGHDQEGKYQHREDAIEAMKDIISELGERIEFDQATDATLSLTYTNAEGLVAVERVALCRPVDDKVDYTIIADGLVAEPGDALAGNKLYNKLADAIYVGISDNQEDTPRTQEITPNTNDSENTVILEL